MLKERIGGTEGVVAKREEARRMVPSPPKVVQRSTFGVRDAVVEVWEEDEESVSVGGEYMGKGRRERSSSAAEGSRMKDIEG